MPDEQTGKELATRWGLRVQQAQGSQERKKH
jgi:hypothetical protein